MNTFAVFAACLVLASCATNGHIPDTADPQGGATAPNGSAAATDRPAEEPEEPIRIAEADLGGHEGAASQPADTTGVPDTGGTPGAPGHADAVDDTLGTGGLRRPVAPEELLDAGSSRTLPRSPGGLPLPRIREPGGGREEGADTPRDPRRSPGAPGESDLPAPSLPPEPVPRGSEPRISRIFTPPVLDRALSPGPMHGRTVEPTVVSPPGSGGADSPVASGTSATSPPTTTTSATTTPATTTPATDTRDVPAADPAPPAAEDAAEAQNPAVSAAEAPETAASAGTQEQDAPPEAKRADRPAGPSTPGSVDARHTVTVGEELELRLPERGWVYLGEDGNREGLSFRRRYTEGDDTVFLFSVDSAGDYMARFQRQDLERGVFGERRVAVDARPEPAAGGGTRVSQMSGEGTGTQTRAAPGGENSAAAPNAAEEEAAGDPSDGAGDSGNAGSSHFGSPSDGESVGSGGLEQAYALLEEGKRERALEAFLQSYPVGDPEVHGTIAELAFELGRYETATSHWMENLDAGAPYEENARLGLFRTALTTGDAETAWEHYGALGGPDVGPGSGPVGAAGEAGRAGAETGGPVAVEPGAADEASGARAEPGAAPISAAELRRLGELLADTENPGRAVAPFEAYLERGGSPEDPATLYFTLGQLYEDRRDARQALVYYRRVVDEYPLSRHWQPAEARVQYLRRHFFDIR